MYRGLSADDPIDTLRIYEIMEGAALICGWPGQWHSQLP
jgi:hypothetical protein